MTTADDPLTLDAIRACRERLGDAVSRTPVHQWRGPRLADLAGSDTVVQVKLELFQVTGTFKPRGALNVLHHLEPDALQRGVAAASGGNHAIAVAYAAQRAGVGATVVMPRTASPVRIERAQAYGAEVILADDIAHAFATAEALGRDEGLSYVHPFEGPYTAQGTATVSLEFAEQAGPLDALIVPIGGGGLCAGMAAAMKQLQPACEVFGVEPEGADTMSRSFATGQPERIDAVRTIADSLGSPTALPYSFGVCRRYVDAVVRVSDDQLRAAMRLLFDEMKLAVEPAAAAATAAMVGPLRDRIAGRRVGIIACGSNIDTDTYTRHVAAAQ